MSNDITSVIGEGENECNESEKIEDSGYGEESIEPTLIVAVLVIFLPRFCPTMGKVNNENKLDDDEQETTNHAKIHPCRSKVSMGNKERANTT